MLEINALATGRRADQYPRSVLCLETFLSRSLRAMVAAFQHRDTLTRILFLNFRTEHLNAAEICSEHYHSLLRILTPQYAKRADKFFYLRLAMRRILSEQFLDSPSFLGQSNSALLMAASSASAAPVSDANSSAPAPNASSIFPLRPQNLITVVGQQSSTSASSSRPSRYPM